MEQNQQEYGEQIQEIAMRYFLKATNQNKAKATELLNVLVRILQDEGSKLVHLGNVLFLVLVRGKGIVEIHTIGEEERPRDLAKNFLDLYKYLKNVGVQVAYTYSEDEKFKKLAKLVNLPVQQYKTKVEDKTYNVFVVKF